tara:strand:- start:396 stop:716 length:321 start_codon:yes stop_codon:yes gene_type:complete
MMQTYEAVNGMGDLKFTTAGDYLMSQENTVTSVTADELRSFIERIERLEQEKKDIMDSVKEVYSEAKGSGYEVKVMRKIISIRKRNRDDIDNENAMTQMYMDALGM